MKKFLNVVKILAVLLLVVGCGVIQEQSITQKLAGEYINYINHGKEERCKIILEKPKNEEDTLVMQQLTLELYEMEHIKFTKNQKS